ncbi:MAG: hypothetical protein ACPG5B_16615 [Chitinophagales bacterium]
MKNISFLFCFLLLSFSADANQKISELANNLVELGRFYRYNGFEHESAEKIRRHLKPLRTPELNATTDFVAQLVKKNNRLLQKKYLQLPNDETLVYVFIMRKVAYNLWKKEPVNNVDLVEKLLHQKITQRVLVSSYYNLLFAAVGNKNRSIDLSKTNFDLSAYNLKTATQRSIFFLQCMDFASRSIRHRMMDKRTANFESAYAVIKKYPTFDGKPYYYYADFALPDFSIMRSQRILSFKNFYMANYYHLLLIHLQCLEKNNADKQAINNLLEHSILRNKSLQSYNNYESYLKKVIKKYNL